jgi:hypothetical protein
LPLSIYLKSGGVALLFLFLAMIVGGVFTWFLTLVLYPLMSESSIIYLTILLFGLYFTVVMIVLGFLLHKKRGWL